MTFDLGKLKKRPSYPFETIAAAVGFSPRLEALVSEAKRLSETLNAKLLLIHVGEKTAKKEDALSKMLSKTGMDMKRCQVIWADGHPVETILSLCKQHVVDLLMIGALKKENLLNYYLGSVARKISRKAKCSVLLLTEASTEESKPKKIIVNGVENPKTIHTLNAALYLAKNYSVKDITVAREVHMPTLTMTMADDSTAPEAREMKKHLNEEESSRLLSMIKKSDTGKIQVKDKMIGGKPGFAISKYARDKKADLLVINSPDTHLNLLDRIFTHDIEYVLADLPCNVLIVHSRI